MKRIEAYSVKSDKTLKSYTKDDLISIIRDLEGAYEGHLETVNRQYWMLANMFNSLLNIGYKQDEIYKMMEDKKNEI